MIIELVDSDFDEAQLHKTSFVSKNRKYIYHFGLIDYAKKFQSLSAFAKMKSKIGFIKDRPLDAGAYEAKFINFLKKNVLIQQFDKESSFNEIE